MKNIFTLFFLSLVLLSCSRDNEDEITENEVPLLTKMILDSGSSFSFEYDNNKRLTKKIGGFVDPGSGTGYNPYFSDKIYTSLNYNNNNVTVEDYSSSSNFNVPKNSKYFVLDNTKLYKKRFLISIMNI